MKKLIITCDLCGKECHPKRHGEVAGAVLKMNPKGEMQEMVFVGQYCEEDIAKVIGFIENLKNEQPRTDTGVKLTNKGKSGSK